ncbi:hypothetical protein AMJ39_09550 [candidate division TA06 bacterium DG_24]|uniref:Uncharacterized protein n=1 Tax=candidate division TA06 bacterium DG_24 TaxID=1703770 RepID=A0A0S7WNC5_UNCT6|nr:MAG: hypothetical protein AMJ39_09550 [candidate division TA06 bacterium DG_24]
MNVAALAVRRERARHSSRPRCSPDLSELGSIPIEGRGAHMDDDISGSRRADLPRADARGVALMCLLRRRHDIVAPEADGSSERLMCG